MNNTRTQQSHTTSKITQNAQPQRVNNFNNSRTIPAYLGDYKVLRQVGEGTYGRVYKGQHKTTGKLYALKVLFHNSPEEMKEGITVTATRELRYLQLLSNQPNVIKLETAFYAFEKDLVLVFEYMDHDLSGLTSHPEVRFKDLEVKYIMKQILEGLHQCHSAGLMHRDIKAANLLIGKENIVKIADFGLATNYIRRSEFSTNVVTLWYRAPELLLGQSKYGPKVDIWSAGCMFIELLTKESPFPGKVELQQMEYIFKACGMPNDHTWPGVTKLPEYKKLTGFPRSLNNLDAMYAHRMSPMALDLLKKMITLDPEKRISASDALDHDYFWNEPPLLTNDMAKTMKFAVASIHEYEMKRGDKISANNNNNNNNKGVPPINAPHQPSHEPSSTYIQNPSFPSNGHPHNREDSYHHNNHNNSNHNYQHHNHHQPIHNHNHHPHPKAYNNNSHGYNNGNGHGNISGGNPPVNGNGNSGNNNNTGNMGNGNVYHYNYGNNNSNNGYHGTHNGNGGYGDRVYEGQGHRGYRSQGGGRFPNKTLVNNGGGVGGAVGGSGGAGVGAGRVTYNKVMGNMHGPRKHEQLKKDHGAVVGGAKKEGFVGGGT